MLEGGGDEVSIIPVVCPRGKVSVSSLGYFSYVGYSSKPSRPFLPLFIGALHIQDYFKNNRVSNPKCINTQEEKARREEKRKQIRVTLQVKLVVILGG